MMFAGEQLLNGLTSVLEQEWPTDALIQIILYADPNMTGIIDRYSCIRNRLLDVSDPREAFLHEWSLWQAGYLRKHCRQGISTDVPVPFRNFRCFLTVKVPCSIGTSREIPLKRRIGSRWFGTICWACSAAIRSVLRTRGPNP